MEELYKMMGGVCQSVCLSVACLNLTRERKGTGSQKLAGLCDVLPSPSCQFWASYQSINQSINQTINQSINQIGLHIYSVMCRRRIRGAQWQRETTATSNISVFKVWLNSLRSSADRQTGRDQPRNFSGDLCFKKTDMRQWTHCVFPVLSKKLKILPESRATRAHWAALISVSIVLSQTPQPKLQFHGHGASVSRGVPV